MKHLQPTTYQLKKKKKKKKRSVSISKWVERGTRYAIHYDAANSSCVCVCVYNLKQRPLKPLWITRNGGGGGGGKYSKSSFQPDRVTQNEKRRQKVRFCAFHDGRETVGSKRSQSEAFAAEYQFECDIPPFIELSSFLSQRLAPFFCAVSSESRHQHIFQ